MKIICINFNLMHLKWIIYLLLVMFNCVFKMIQLISVLFVNICNLSFRFVLNLLNISMMM